MRISGDEKLTASLNVRRLVLRAIFLAQEMPPRRYESWRSASLVTAAYRGPALRASELYLRHRRLQR